MARNGKTTRQKATIRNSGASRAGAATRGLGPNGSWKSRVRPAKIKDPAAREAAVNRASRGIRSKTRVNTIRPTRKG